MKAYDDDAVEIHAGCFIRIRQYDTPESIGFRVDLLGFGVWRVSDLIQGITIIIRIPWYRCRSFRNLVTLI